MKKNLFQGLTLFMLMAITTIAIPNFAVAASTIQYQPRNTQELIAYLYGRIVQLQEIQKLLQSGGSSQTNNLSLLDGFSLNTKKADDVTDTTAFLRGEVVLFGETTVKAWFEYGKDEDFLDFTTRQTSVRTAYNRAIRTKITKLKEEERYYFRLVAQDNKGNLSYGSVFAFRTDESND